MFITHIGTAYRLEPLRLPQDEGIFLTFLAETKDYFTDYQVRPAGDEDLVEFFEEIPPGTELNQKTFLGIFVGQELIGILDVLADYPQLQTSIIGYLVLRQDYRGRGLAQVIYQWVEERAQAQGQQVLRLGVIADNLPALNFWRKQGFRQIGETATDYGLQFLMEKAINTSTELS